MGVELRAYTVKFEEQQTISAIEDPTLNEKVRYDC